MPRPNFLSLFVYHRKGYDFRNMVWLFIYFGLDFGLIFSPVISFEKQFLFWNANDLCWESNRLFASQNSDRIQTSSSMDANQIEGILFRTVRNKKSHGKLYFLTGMIFRNRYNSSAKPFRSLTRRLPIKGSNFMAIKTVSYLLISDQSLDNCWYSIKNNDCIYFGLNGSSNLTALYFDDQLNFGMIALSLVLSQFSS